MLTRLSHSFFRRHPGQLLLAVIGIAAGVAVVTGVALLRGALVESLDAVSSELVNDRALVLRHASGRLPVERYRELAIAPGAPDWVPLIRVPARVDDARIELLGLDPFSGVRGMIAEDAGGGESTLAAALYAGDDDLPAALASPATLNLLGLSPGDVVEVRLADGSARLRIGAPVRARPGLDRRLILDIAELQRAIGARGWVSELLAPAEAEAWIRARLDDTLLLTTARRQQANARQLTEGMRANLTAMSLLALATGLFVVYSVLSFLMVQRRREFALLRALGMTPSRLARMLSAEVLAIAALGGLLGLVAGTLLSDRLLQLVAAPVAEVYGRLPAAATQPDLLLYAMIWATGLFAALIAALPVVSDALRIPPGRMVRAPAARSWPLAWLLALASALIAAGALWVLLDGRLFAALGGLFLMLAGLIPVAPRLGFGLIDFTGRRFRRGLAGRALRLLGGARGRLTPAMAALSLALALALGMGMMILNFRTAVDDWVAQLLRADLYVSMDQRALDRDDVRRLAALAGVRALSSVRSARLVDGTRLTSYRLPPEAWSGFDWRGEPPAGGYQAFRAGEIALVSEPFSRRQELTPGDEVQLTTPEGDTLTLPVAGVFREFSSEQGFIAISSTLYRERFGDPRVDSVGLYLDAGLDAEAFAETLPPPVDDAARASEWSTITPAEIRRQSLAVFDRTFRISWALAGLVGLIALVALTSALLAQGLERAREHATLRALGLTPGRLSALITLQSAALTGAALVLAIPLAVLIHYALSLLVQPRAFGWSLPAGLPPLEPVLLVAPAALLLGTLTGLYPAWRIRGRPIVEHLRAGR